MTDRRSFFARALGALAGLVASKHVTIEPTKPANKVMYGTLESIEVDGQQVYPIEPISFDPKPMSYTVTGYRFVNVTIDGQPLDDVFEITNFGYPPRPDGSFWGRVSTYKPAPKPIYLWESGASVSRGRQEFTYIGWVTVPAWVETTGWINKKT